jgi:hypothetical protein
MTAIAASRFAVKPLPQDVATHVREQGRDPVWGHQAVTQPATGFGPCRLCLRTFREGEELRTLFTHDTYAGVADFPQPDRSSSTPTLACLTTGTDSLRSSVHSS